MRRTFHRVLAPAATFGGAFYRHGVAPVGRFLARRMTAPVGPRVRLCVIVFCALNLSIIGYYVKVWADNTFWMTEFKAACFEQRFRRDDSSELLAPLAGPYTDAFWRELIRYQKEPWRQRWFDQGMAVTGGRLHVLKAYYYPKQWYRSWFKQDAEERAYLATDAVAKRLFAQAKADGLDFGYDAWPWRPSEGSEPDPDWNGCAILKDMIHVDGALAQARRAQAAKAEP